MKNILIQDLRNQIAAVTTSQNNIVSEPVENQPQSQNIQRISIAELAQHISRPME